jgi:hypothetical protein
MNGFDKVTKVYVSSVSNFSKGASSWFVRRPIGRGRYVYWIFGKIRKCSLKALRQLYFCGSGCRTVVCSEENGYCKW